MKYITGYVWRKQEDGGKAQESVLLQQVLFGRRQVVLACVCDGGALSGYVTGRMKLWLEGKGEELFGRRMREEAVIRAFEQECKILREDTVRYEKCGGKGIQSLAAVLIVDAECYLWKTGEGCFYLLNRKYERSHRRPLCEGEEEQVVCGRIQKGAGIFLGFQHFVQGVSKEAMLQCLAVQEIREDGQINVRLRELAEEGCRQGYTGECSAVYIKSV